MKGITSSVGLGQRRERLANWFGRGTEKVIQLVRGATNIAQQMEATLSFTDESAPFCRGETISGLHTIKG